MPNHPNRSRSGNRAANPKAEEIRAVRVAAGLTQTDAATKVHVSLRNWQQWEAGDRRMPPGLWELFETKLKHPELFSSGNE